MAAKLFFTLFVDQPADAATDSPDKRIGYFACMPWAAKFLDIEDKAVKSKDGASFTKRKGGGRSLTRVDGVTKLTALKDNVAESESLNGFTDGRGGKRIVLVTGKPVTDSKAKKKTFHTIGFSFPSFATNLIISQALGRIIPAAKMEANPGVADIYPWFRSSGGKRYPIILMGSGTPSSDQPTVKVGAEMTVADLASSESQRQARQG